MKKIFKNVVVTLIALGFSGGPTTAKEANPASASNSVTLAPKADATKRYEGSLANKKVLMLLADRPAWYRGGYAYLAGDNPSSLPRWINLDGKKNPDGSISLQEKVAGKITGQFRGRITGNKFAGTWSSPAGKKFDFTLVEATGPGPKFMADVVGPEDDRKIKTIRVYRGGQPVQSIPVDLPVFGFPSNYQYQNADYNFDGYPDFFLSIEDTARIYLLFDPAKNSFALAPASLQRIEATGVDYNANEVIEEWGGSQERGMNIYRFVNGQYCLVQENVVSGPAKTAGGRKKTYPVSPCQGRKE